MMRGVARSIVLAGVAMALAAIAVPPRAPAVRPLFDLISPEGGPFPSDAFTVADANQVTGRRVNLPKPDCLTRPSDCEDIAVLNALDGFNMKPRLSIPFSGAIDPASLGGRAVFLVRLADRQVIGINQIVWDVATSTLHAFPDEALDEHARYAIVVTRSVRDASGAAIEPSERFRRFLQSGSEPYRGSLIDAVGAAGKAGVPESEIVVAATFTTQTFSHVITRLRDAIVRAPAPRLNFAVGPGGARAVFAANAIESITSNADINPGGPLTDLPLTQLLTQMRAIPGAVGAVAFGTFRTLDFTTPTGYIAPIPTRTGTLTPTGSIDVSFDLWLPSGAPPPGGWPIVLYGTGSFGHKDTAFSHAAVLTSHRLAVIGINPIGRGRGPRSTTTVKLTDGTSATVSAPGLGRDTNGDGTIDPWEPRRTPRPYTVLNTSGSIAQAAAQFWALVRGIQAGVDVDGDGKADLDASRIYYLGQSLGAMFGMPVFAYEPAIRAAVFTVPVGTLIYNSARTPGDRSSLGQLLAARVPSLINAADGVTAVDGVAVTGPFFNENLPLRNEPPRVNTIAGAMDIQRVLDRIAWAAQMCSTVAFAPSLRRAPPAGAPARPFVVQWARSD
jgi:Bacterial Ig-like domain